MCRTEKASDLFPPRKVQPPKKRFLNLARVVGPCRNSQVAEADWEQKELHFIVRMAHPPQLHSNRERLFKAAWISCYLESPI